MRCCLNFLNSPIAAGSPDRMRLSDEEIQAVSHCRVWRSVAPLRSGPTRTPCPTAWQLLHFLMNVVAGSVAADACRATTHMKMPNRTTSLMAALLRAGIRHALRRQGVCRAGRKCGSVRSGSVWMSRPAAQSPTTFIRNLFYFGYVGDCGDAKRRVTAPVHDDQSKREVEG